MTLAHDERVWEARFPEQRRGGRNEARRATDKRPRAALCHRRGDELAADPPLTPGPAVRRRSTHREVRLQQPPVRERSHLTTEGQFVRPANAVDEREPRCELLFDRALDHRPEWCDAGSASDEKEMRIDDRRRQHERAEGTRYVELRPGRHLLQVRILRVGIVDLHEQLQHPSLRRPGRRAGDRVWLVQRAPVYAHDNGLAGREREGAIAEVDLDDACARSSPVHLSRPKDEDRHDRIIVAGDWGAGWAVPTATRLPEGLTCPCARLLYLLATDPGLTSPRYSTPIPDRRMSMSLTSGTSAGGRGAAVSIALAEDRVLVCCLRRALSRYIRLSAIASSAS